jgi:hypothetical protein
MTASRPGNTRKNFISDRILSRQGIDIALFIGKIPEQANREFGWA